MFRFTMKPSSGSHSQYVAKITHSVQCEYVEVVQTLSVLWLCIMTCEACVLCTMWAHTLTQRTAHTLNTGCGSLMMVSFKPKHVGAASLILKCFNNSMFFNVVCISRTIKVFVIWHILCKAAAVISNGWLRTRSFYCLLRGDEPGQCVV